jgi:predicted dehydrogenase
MKVALIGYGRWGKNLYRSISTVKQVTDVYVVDPFLKDSNNDLKNITFDEVLSDEEIESVIVASPATTHFEFTKNLILNNKNVFCEKPLCFSSAEASEIGKLVEEHKKIVLTGHTFLFNDSINYVKNYIEENSLSFKTISGKYCSYGTNVADVDVLWDFGPHVISIMNYVLSSKPSNLEIIPNSYRSDGKLESCILNLKYFDGLTNVAFELSWLSIDKKRFIEFNNYETLLKWDDVNIDRPIEIYEKQLDETVNPSGIFEHFHTIGNKITIPSLSPTEPLLNEMNYFIDSVLSKKSKNLKSGIEFTESVIKLLEDASSKI